MKAIIIAIGDEILIGQITNTNAAWLGQQLNLIGIDVYEMMTISDSKEHILRALDYAFSQADLILTTGGLGPTKDDITKIAMAAYFETELVLNEELLKNLEAYFKLRGREMTEQGRTVAYLPKDCDNIMNQKGTAPAMWFERDEKVLVAMPGVPYEMKNFMETEILGRLQAKQGSNLAIYHKTLMVAGVGETEVARRIEDLENGLPDHIKLAYLPNLGVLRLRLSGSGSDETKLQAEINGLANQIRETIPHLVYGEDEIKLEQVLGEMLVERGAKLGIAESCTGGTIAKRIVSVPGSSRYFEGGVVAYSYDLKKALLGVKSESLKAHGAVSEQVVTEMAMGAIERLNLDYVIATSGIAGPGGGTAEKPVGTIWVAIASKNGGLKTKKFQLSKHRDINIGLTTNLALNELRKFMNKETVEMS